MITLRSLWLVTLGLIAGSAVISTVFADKTSFVASLNFCMGIVFLAAICTFIREDDK